MKIVMAAIAALTIVATSANAEATEDNSFCKNYVELWEPITEIHQKSIMKDSQNMEDRRELKIRQMKTRREWEILREWEIRRNMAGRRQMEDLRDMEDRQNMEDLRQMEALDAEATGNDSFCEIYVGVMEARQNAEATNTVISCEYYVYLRESIMENRQNGMSKEILLAAIDGDDNESIRKWIDNAYLFAIGDTEAEKDELVKVFGQQRYENCG